MLRVSSGWHGVGGGGGEVKVENEELIESELFFEIGIYGLIECINDRASAALARLSGTSSFRARFNTGMIRATGVHRSLRAGKDLAMAPAMVLDWARM